MMNRYELTYIIDTALEETARKELIEKVSALIAANGGEVEKVDEEPWGKGAKRLAYPINYKTEGWYVLVTFKATCPVSLNAIWRFTTTCSAIWL
jgi:small subunit ribosomal protein S6